MKKQFLALGYFFGLWQFSSVVSLSTRWKKIVGNVKGLRELFWKLE